VQERQFDMQHPQCESVAGSVRQRHPVRHQVVVC
jgi:hypothetical protein